MTSSTGNEESFIRVLVLDVATAHNRFVENPDPSHKRDLVRTTFTAIEGLIYMYRDDIIRAAQTIDALSKEEEAIFLDTSYHVDDQGQIKGRARRISMVQTLRATARIATKLNSNLEVNFGDEKWAKMQETIEIRNRITHAKSAQDLVITDEETQVCLDSFEWQLETTVNALKETLGILAKFSGEMKTLLKELKGSGPA